MGILKRIAKIGVRLGLKTGKAAKKVITSPTTKKAATKVKKLTIREGKKLEAELKKELRNLKRKPVKKRAKKKTKKKATRKKKK